MGVEGIVSHHKHHKISCQVKLTVGGLIFWNPSLLNFIRQFLKLPYILWKVLNIDISYVISCPFVFLWTCFGPETHRGNQSSSWFSQNIFCLWSCDFHLVKTSKLQRNVQGDVLVTTIDLSVFPNITKITIFHIHSCELNKCHILPTCERFLPELLPSGSWMIHIQWCYNC